MYYKCDELFPGVTYLTLSTLIKAIEDHEQPDKEGWVLKYQPDEEHEQGGYFVHILNFSVEDGALKFFAA